MRINGNLFSYTYVTPRGLAVLVIFTATGGYLGFHYGKNFAVHNYFTTNPFQLDTFDLPGMAIGVGVGSQLWIDLRKIPYEKIAKWVTNRFLGERFPNVCPRWQNVPEAESLAPNNQLQTININSRHWLLEVAELLARRLSRYGSAFAIGYFVTIVSSLEEFLPLDVNLEEHGPTYAIGLTVLCCAFQLYSACESLQMSMRYEPSGSPGLFSVKGQPPNLVIQPPQAGSSLN